LALRGLQLGVAINEYADIHQRGDFLIRGILGPTNSPAPWSSATPWMSARQCGSKSAMPPQPTRT
jgi:hypothetical protein